MAYNGYYANRNRSDEDVRHPEEETKGQTETFVTRNVKLITFLCCLGVFLAFFGPWSIIRIVQWVEQSQLEAEMAETTMTMSEMETLIQKGKKLSWADFQGYYYETLWETGMCIRQYSVEGGTYSVLVSAVSEHAALDSVLVVRAADGEEIDLLVDDAQGFIQ